MNYCIIKTIFNKKLTCIHVKKRSKQNFYISYFYILQIELNRAIEQHVQTSKNISLNNNIFRHV